MDLLGALEREGAALSAAVRRTDLAAPVPCCPGWTVADLVSHTGGVHRRVAAIVRSASPDPPAGPRPVGPAGPAVLDWFDEGRADLLDVLRSTDPGAPAWNWSSAEPPTAAFWRRRMAQETAVHRVDAEEAAGAPSAIDAALAADGIDEWLDVHLRSDVADPGVPEPAPLGTLHLHCTDTEGEWWAALDGRRLDLRREHRKGDVAARGPASDLLLVAWGRRPAGSLDVVGDAAVLDTWLALAEG